MSMVAEAVIGLSRCRTTPAASRTPRRVAVSGVEPGVRGTPEWSVPLASECLLMIMMMMLMMMMTT